VTAPGHLRAFRRGVDDELITGRTTIDIEDLRAHRRVGLVVIRIAVVVPDDDEAAVAKRCDAASNLAAHRRGVHQKLATPLDSVGHRRAPPLVITRAVASRGCNAWRVSPRLG